MARNLIYILLISGGTNLWLTLTARSFSPIDRHTANLNGAILWATTMAIGAWLLANGVAGTFGIAASNAGNIANQAQQSGVTVPSITKTPGTTGNAKITNAPNITAQNAREIASTSGD